MLFESLKSYDHFPLFVGKFLVDKVVPQANGDAAKVKVKVRVDIHGVFKVSSATMVEKVDKAPEEVKEEPMETENGQAQPEEKAEAQADADAEAPKENGPQNAENNAEEVSANSICSYYS